MNVLWLLDDSICVDHFTVQVDEAGRYTAGFWKFKTRFLDRKER